MSLQATTSFNLQVDDLIDAAMARVGGPAATGWEAESATRALGLLFQTLTVRGTNLWQMESASALTLTEDVAYVTLPTDTVDVRSVRVYSTSDSPRQENMLTRLSYAEYDGIVDKTLSGEPTQYFLDRQRATYTLYVYPVPDDGTYRVLYRKIRKPFDNTLMASDVDAPARWFPALVSGLAYHIALERSDVPGDKLDRLQAKWEQDYAEAAAEDKEMANIRVRPNLSCYTRL